ncbi:MAG: L,D-transpeptidase [Candidatus Aegiribacteria sp.]|nr:L,D-transpeptidase [Candidatus Aegiribacteria sp.]
MICLTELFRIFLGILAVSWTTSFNPAPASGNTSSREAVILIDFQTIVFLEDGREANLALVSTGRAGYDTPTGTFEVLYRRRSPVSSSYNVRMPYWLCIHPSGQIGLHQTFLSGTNSLGIRKSHGCIRLGKTTARWSYYWLSVGSTVRVQAESPRRSYSSDR